MQIYIHVPFCRKKCHYCDFYSVPKDSSNKDTLDLPENNLDNVTTKGRGINLFDAKKEIEEEENLLFSTNSTEKHAPYLDTINVKLNTLKPLSALIPNTSEKNTQVKQGVQSLADILRSKSDTKVTNDSKASQITGPTLADVLLHKDQAKHLRNSFGLPQLEDKKTSNESNIHNSTSSLKDTSSQAFILSKEETQLISSAKNIKSLILGKTIHHEDLNTVNDHMRSALNGSNISTFDNAARFPLPSLLPKIAIENNSLSQDPVYQLWRKALLAEIKILSEFHADTPITSIFFGGGTPSLIPIKDMEAILRTIFKTFHITHNAEISMEANPESITKEKAIAYSRMGFNRISLGIQSLQDENLKIMGRSHSALDAIKAFHTLRNARFRNISIDLMWGLPNQKNKNWCADIKEAITLDPEHISCYGLSIEEGSLFDDWKKNGSLQFPPEEEQALMYKTTSQLLKEAGYLQYEISNFSKLGFQCRHNLGYWQGIDYMGLGPAAASTIGNIRRTHARSIVEWAQDIQRGTLAQDIRSQLANNTSPSTSPDTSNNTSNEVLNSASPTISPNFDKEILSTLDRILELIMLRLRTSKGLALSEYKELTRHSFMSDHKSLIHLLDKHNLLRINKGHVFLTPNGMLVSTSILEKFFDNTKDIFRHAK